MNRPLQVSADCLAFFFSSNARAPLACIHSFPWIYPRLKICSPNKQRVIKLRRWTVQNNANQSSCDQGGTFACNCGRRGGREKRERKHIATVFMCLGSNTATCYATPVRSNVCLKEAHYLLDERRSDTQKRCSGDGEVRPKARVRKKPCSTHAYTKHTRVRTRTSQQTVALPRANGGGGAGGASTSTPLIAPRTRGAMQQ